MKLKYEPMPIEKEIEISKKSLQFIKKEYVIHGNKLICLGVEHTSDLKKPQFGEIKKVIEDNIIHTIVLEISKEQLEKYNESENKIRFNEKGFIIELAEEKGIELVPGDWDIKDILMKNYKRFGEEETILLGVLLYLNKRKTNIKEEIKKVYDSINNGGFYFPILQELKKEKDFDEKDFRNLVEEFIKKNNNKKLNELTEKDNIIPSPIKNKTKLNKIMREISYKRDEFMLNNILEHIKEKKVLYIAGKNHVIRHEPFLRKVEAS